MAYQNEQQKSAPEQDEKHLPEEELNREPISFGLPNSLMLAMPITPPPGTPNSVMREMMDNPTPFKEEETSGAYTRSSEISSRGSGFEPFSAAHELVHTVKHRAPSGKISRSVSDGTIQRGFFDFFRKKKTAGPESGRPRSNSDSSALRPAEPSAGSRPRSGSTGQISPSSAAPARITRNLSGSNGLLGNIIEDYDPQTAAAAVPAPPSREASPEAGPDSSSQPPSSSSHDAAAAAAVLQKAEDAASEVSAPPVTNILGLPLEASPEEKEQFRRFLEEDDDDDTDVPFMDLDEEDSAEEDIAPDLTEGDEERDIASDLPELAGNAQKSLSLQGEEGLSGPNAGKTTTTGEEDSIRAGGLIIHDGKLYQPVVDVETGELVFIGEDGEIIDKDGNPVTFSSEEEDDTEPLDDTETEPDDDTETDTDDDFEEEDEEDVSVRHIGADADIEFPARARHSRGPYRRGSRLTKYAKEGSSIAGAANGALMAFKGTDELVDLASINGLKWGSEGQSLDYDTTEGPFLNGATSLVGTGTALVNTVTGARETIRKGKNIRAGASLADAATSGMDTLSAAGTFLSSGAKFLNTAGAAVGGAADFIPGMNIATGALTATSGGVQAFRGIRSLRKINKEIELLQKRVWARRRREKAAREIDKDWTLLPDDTGDSSLIDVDESGHAAGSASAPRDRDEEEEIETPEEKHQNKLWQIFHQGKWVGEYNRTAGLMKTGSGVLTATSGIATLTGAGAAVGAGLGAASGALTAGRFVYDKKKKKHIRRRVIAQELGLKYEDLKDKNRRKRLMRINYGANSEKEVFKRINMERARYLLETAGWDALKEDDAEAEAADNVINALGVHRKKNGGYAEGALELLAEKLGVG